jgi:hypothetical protein
MGSSPVPRHVFVTYYPEGPHAGPITIGLFGVQDGALLPVFSSRQKAIDFAIRTLGSPPNPKESWDGVELPAADLMHFLLGDPFITYVATDPPSSGDVELVLAPEFVERLELEAGGEINPTAPLDFRQSLVRSLIYGDVS